jgi:hypothetical protein
LFFLVAAVQANMTTVRSLLVDKNKYQINWRVMKAGHNQHRQTKKQTI